MALDPLATTDDVVAVFRPLTTAETALAGGLLDQASMKLRLAARALGLDLAVLMLDELTAEAVKAAVVNAVKRVLKNPDGWRQKSRTDGPFTESGTVDAVLSSGELYLDDGDLADIFPAAHKQRFRSFRVNAGLA